MSPRASGLDKSGCMLSVVIRVQVYSVGSGVIVVYIERSECC